MTGVTWEQEVYEMLCDVLLQFNEVLSTDPDMPSHERTMAEAERVFKGAIKRLKEEDMLPDELRDIEV